MNGENFKIVFDNCWIFEWNWKDKAPFELPRRFSNFDDKKLKDSAIIKILNEWLDKGYLV